MLDRRKCFLGIGRFEEISCGAFFDFDFDLRGWSDDVAGLVSRL